MYEGIEGLQGWAFDLSCLSACSTSALNVSLFSEPKALAIRSRSGYTTAINELPRSKLRGINFCSGPSFRAW
ncbi:protein of unknown function [Candidatus Methylomirabilis oxygeniifera]|uniref:Uncharacterized protein n=1 Tax=Methylomirabilis oxygeniifera TaxID=671143 RepID=D5MJF3_METO1|nr:protein of unknown function [Candidatus Methylomirabilis oxyfera]